MPDPQSLHAVYLCLAGTLGMQDRCTGSVPSRKTVGRKDHPSHGCGWGHTASPPWGTASPDPACPHPAPRRRRQPGSLLAAVGTACGLGGWQCCCPRLSARWPLAHREFLHAINQFAMTLTEEFLSNSSFELQVSGH